MCVCVYIYIYIYMYICINMYTYVVLDTMIVGTRPSLSDTCPGSP